MKAREMMAHDSPHVSRRFGTTSHSLAASCFYCSLLTAHCSLLNRSFVLVDYET